MTTHHQSRSYSRRSAGILLLVGVLAGVSVGGGVGVIAASSTKSVTVCADTKTNVLRYAKNGKCAKTETKVVLNQTGAAGAKGDAGAAGAKGDTGAAGTAGTKGDTGTAGTKGDAGDAGDAGVVGAAGASSPTGFTARSVCGSNGTTLCAVGVPGPGGGTIVYVDSTNEMPGYDYLEVAPGNAASDAAWSTSTAECGSAASTSCLVSFVSDAGTALEYFALGTGRAATAAIVARHNVLGVAKGSYAAGLADAYTTTKASDWFLPSRDELNEVCKYAGRAGQTPGPGTLCGSSEMRTGFYSGSHWSSSEDQATTALSQSFPSGGRIARDKSTTPYYVRAVRAF